MDSPSLEKKYIEKFREMKRIILSLKLRQSPLEFTYSHKHSLKNIAERRQNKMASQIPIYTGKIENVKVAEKAKKSKAPFILDLVPHIQFLHPKNTPRQPYREKFQAEYDESYSKLAESYRLK
jgi:hypothetical protein